MATATTAITAIAATATAVTTAAATATATGHSSNEVLNLLRSSNAVLYNLTLEVEVSTRKRMVHVDNNDITLHLNDNTVHVVSL
jgi:S-adenosylmethionine:tRNA-ribosyltransferase-isomerase (queuine synthetase)